MDEEISFYWFGKHSSELTREELLKVIKYLKEDLDQIREDRDRWRASGNSIEYLRLKV